MTSYLLQGDAARIPLSDQSVHCVITSPPYWGLRKYAGTQGRIWGGDPECEHEWHQNARKLQTGGASAKQQSNKGVDGFGWLANDATCRECLAWYGSLGLEPTPEQHVKNIVEICREVRRVLGDDGVFWLNYGDSYASSPPGNKQVSPTSSLAGAQSSQSYRERLMRKDTRGAERPKATVAQGSLMMMPHRVALALQADGWIVRQDLVWFKRNPMPESVAGTRWVKHRIKEKRSKHATEHNIKGGTEAMLRDASIHQGIDEDWIPEYIDCPGCEKCIPNDGLVLKRGSFRHTRAHEYVFQLVKGPKMIYWSNQEAVKEIGASGPSDIRKMEEGLDRIGGKHKMLDDPLSKASASTNIGQKRSVGDPSGRNPRSVLDVPTQPYRGAHYATFPVNLIAPLIRATCPRWACPVCGKGWAPVVETKRSPATGMGPKGDGREDAGLRTAERMGHGAGWRDQPQTKSNVLGYRPTCEHEHTQEEAVPGIVFDPFVGSGTTVMVAKQLLRHGIGLDISMPYLDGQAKPRTNLGSPREALDGLPLFEGLSEPEPSGEHRTAENDQASIPPCS